jgi:hypothetical protein
MLVHFILKQTCDITETQSVKTDIHYKNQCLWSALISPQNLNQLAVVHNRIQCVINCTKILYCHTPCNRKHWKTLCITNDFKFYHAHQSSQSGAIIGISV